MEAEEESPSKKNGQARRPMNAFLIFCKRHRTLVREKNPHIDNRSVTRILGELWAKLSQDEKASYTSLANEYKEAFMKANPDYKWFNTDKSHPVREGKPSTRPTNSLVAYHGEVPRSEGGESGQHQHLAPPNSAVNYKPQKVGMSHPGTTMHAVPKQQQQQQQQQHQQQHIPGNGIMDLSKPPASNIDRQQISMAMELMKCVSQANSYSGLPKQTSAAVSTATTNNTVTGETKPSKDYGNVSLLHLAKMCSDELENNNKLQLQNGGAGGRTAESQSTMLTPPWTPQYDRSYSPPKVENVTGVRTGPDVPTAQQAAQQVKQQKDKENLPLNMQTEKQEKMTLKEYKSQNGAAAPVKTEHFKNLILSTESDVTSCGKLVVSRVIESIYSQEIGKVEPKPTDARLKNSTIAPTPVTSTYTPRQLHNINSSKTGDKAAAGSFFTGSHAAQIFNTKSDAVKKEVDSDATKDSAKMTLTFGQIQETLIRKAVENSYDFDIVSGLKRENTAYLQDPKDNLKTDKKAVDYSVFDFQSSDSAGGQNISEVSSNFESRIKSKKFEQSNVSAIPTGNGVLGNEAKLPHHGQQARSANEVYAGSHSNRADNVTMPPKGSVPYMNQTAMELLRKCDEMSKGCDSKSVPSSKSNGLKRNGSSAISTNQNQAYDGSAASLANQSSVHTSPVAAQKSPPVPLKKRKFHLPIESEVDEKAAPLMSKRPDRTFSIDSLNQDENSRDSNDSTGSRKSKRCNRGQRYKALIKQGVLQGSREKGRKNSNGSEAGTPNSEDTPTLPPNTQIVPPNTHYNSPHNHPRPKHHPLPCVNWSSGQTSAPHGDHVTAPRPIRKRTYSEVNTTFTTPSRIRRYTTGDFDLEAHIASLPVVDIDGVARKNICRPRPKPKIRHHSESSLLSNPGVPNHPVSSNGVHRNGTSKPNALLASVTSLSPKSVSNNGKVKMINIAELRKVIRQRSEVTSRERTNSGSVQAGSAAKRKARKQAITRLIPVTSSQVGKIAGHEASDPKKKAVETAVVEGKPNVSYNLDSGRNSSEGQTRRQIVTCP